MALVPVAPTRFTLLDTEHWWAATRRGARRIVHVDQLDQDHRVELLRWLRQHADVCARWQDSWDYQLYLEGVLTAAQYTDRQHDRRAVAPEVWIEETPLVRRLVALVAYAPAPRHRGHRG